MAYDKPGAYKNGVWLVAKEGKGAYVDRLHLPATGHGYSYYWLGSNDAQAGARALNAMQKLGVDPNWAITSGGTLKPVSSVKSSHGTYGLGHEGMVAWLSNLAAITAVTVGVGAIGEGAPERLPVDPFTPAETGNIANDYTPPEGAPNPDQTDPTTDPTDPSKSGKDSTDPTKSGKDLPPSSVPQTATHGGIPGLSALDIFGVFGKLGFWKGIGLVLAGAAILVFAALEFRKMT